jgi:hypothetical protein
VLFIVTAPTATNLKWIYWYVSYLASPHRYISISVVNWMVLIKYCSYQHLSCNVCCSVLFFTSKNTGAYKTFELSFPQLNKLGKNAVTELRIWDPANTCCCRSCCDT